MRNQKMVLSGILLFLSSALCGQNTSWCYPLRIKPLLSGNFGELRDTHFHSGLDFKTEGREGLPVICVKDGVLARVKVSPTGYGNALYIRHANGTTTVYGHLKRFIPRIEKKVRAMQYENESFAVDAGIEHENICFRAGDTIAYSGNSGSSMGPHLHFEVRDTRSEHPLNPLLFLKVVDKMAPNVRSVFLYGFSEEGVLVERRRIGVKNEGGKTYNLGKIKFPFGKVGIGVQADDYMNGSWNKLGLYELELFAGDKLISRMKMDTTSFEQTFLVNEVKDFQLYRENAVVYTTFGNYRNELPGVETMKNRGFVDLQQDSVVPVRLVLKDINGNASRVSLVLTGGEKEEQTETSGKKIVDGARIYRLEHENYRLELSPGTLQYPLVFDPVIEFIPKDSTEQIKIFSVTEKEWPLLKESKLEIHGSFSEKSMICLVGKRGRLFPLKTRRTREGLVATPRVLGRYTVVRDTVAPFVAFLGKASGKVRFKIKDILSGIDSFRVEVNGKWCLFAYDAKKDLLEGSLNEPVFVKGKNRVVLKVTDVVGNITIFETIIVK